MAIHLKKEEEFDDQALFFLCEGEVEILIKNKTGFNEDTSLQILNAGFFILWCKCVLQFFKEGKSFGELAFFSGMKRTATAVSRTFSSLIMIKREEFLRLIAQNPFDYVLNFK